MNVKLLIDGIVRQTTVLIAQLSTAAGIRAPLAHVADEVFLSLAREIEAQGVGRKVVADMFGLALRTYQVKVQRLEESTTSREQTLWEVVLRYVAEADGVTRAQVLERFRHDGEREVVAVLCDLVSSGLLHAAGRGRATIYGVTTEAERRRLADQDDDDAALAMIWATAYQTPASTVRSLTALLRIDESVVRSCVERLVADGRLRRDDDSDGAPLSAIPLLVPVGAAQGWEMAVYDHFRAVANSIAAKIRSGRTRSSRGDVIGGATYSFDVSAGHPYEQRVYGMLRRVRGDIAALWDELDAFNREHPIAEEDKATVWFYLGQNVEGAYSEDEERAERPSEPQESSP